MPGNDLDRIAGAPSANLRASDWLARFGPSEFPGLLEGVTVCVGIAGLAPDASPSEVHRRATLCFTAARSIGVGRVIRYGGSRP